MKLAELKEKVRQFPKKPGVYLMLGKAGQVLYVGKATDLRARVRSYFAKDAGERYQVKFLMSKVHDLEVLVTDTAKEALLLENTLIKKHHPRYNIDLKDDKSYLSLKLSINHEAPRLYPTRRIKKDGGIYYGPYASAGACREVVDFIERHFKLRTCSDHEYRNRSRPCLQYDIKRCDAPCVGFISLGDYGKMVEEVRFFLEGKGKKLRKIAEAKMRRASEEQQYEEAARYRDLIADMDTTLEKQKVVSHATLNQDVLGLHREGERVQISILKVREGALSQHRSFAFRSIEETPELLGSFVAQYYEASHQIPKEILLPRELPEQKVLEDILRDRAGNKIRLLTPKRGEKLKLIQLAEKNAAQAMRAKLDQEQERQQSLSVLGERLHLQNIPERIECYDISHFQGGETVGAMVVFWHGEPVKKFYRRFSVKSVQGPDDFASLYEVLIRRLKRGLKAEGSKDKDPWALPDLILIDGGKGQLNAAAQAMKDLKLTGIDLAALAKSRLESGPAPGTELSHRERSEERCFIPGRKNPIFLKPHSEELHTLMRARDEAHRFGITSHRKAQGRQSLASGLGKISGIGPVKSKRLLQHFGSLKSIKEAPIAELAQVLGSNESVARRLKSQL